MITFLSLLLGALGPHIGKLLGLLTKTIDHKHQMELMRLQGELEVNAEAFKAIVASSNAVMNERASARDHDTALYGKSVFFDKMRSSVIPILTYLFVVLYFTMKGLLIWYLGTDQGIDIVTAVRLVLDEETTEFFTCIMAFWFGSTSPMIQRPILNALEKVKS